MLFITLLTMMTERSREAFEELRKVKPPSGVTVKSMYGLFGRHDILVIYESSDENESMEFLFNLRKVGGVIDSETFLATEIERVHS